VDYKPAPRDTSGVKLPRQIAELTELLAVVFALFRRARKPRHS
jgi:hypothetical protein